MINTLYVYSKRAENLCVDGTDLSERERKFKFWRGNRTNPKLKNDALIKSQTGRKRKRRRKNANTRAIENNTHAIRIIYT